MRDKERIKDLKYIDRPSGCFIDRKMSEPQLEPVDVIMLTLDAENFLERCLYTVYREIPVRKLLVCDGGSKDGTIEILKKFPRVEVFVKPDIRTTGKTLEFLISLVETEWYVVIDSDIELSPGWYDEMCKHKTTYDVLENSRRILAYHFYREDKTKLNPNTRAYDMCHLIRKSATQNFHCDDDYMWRYTDFFLRQTVENSGHKYGKTDTASHIHNETERVPYESDEEKNYQKLVFYEPRWITTDQKKAQSYLVKHAKAIVKYLDPEHPLIKNNRGFDDLLRLLDREWIAKNGPAWLSRYDHFQDFQDFDKKRNAEVYRRYITTKNEATAKELAKVMYAQLSNELLDKHEVKRVLIIGTNQFARAYYTVCQDLDLKFASFGWGKKTRAILLNKPVIPLKQALDLKPSIIVSTEAEHSRLVEKTYGNLKDNFTHIEPFDVPEKSESEQTVLVFGDQDDYFDKPQLQSIIEILTKDNTDDVLQERPKLGNSALKDWSRDGVPKKWTLGGGEASVQRIIVDSNEYAQLTNDGTITGFLVQRISKIHDLQDHLFAAGCWIRSDTPNVARIQIITDKGEIASDFHTGNGDWEFCGVTAQIEDSAKYVDVYLQVLRRGKAIFRDVMTCVKD